MRAPEAARTLPRGQHRGSTAYDAPMGWDCEDVALTVSLRLDAHGGDKEREHGALAADFRQRLWEAVRPVLTDPRYAEIILFPAEFYDWTGTAE